MASIYEELLNLVVDYTEIEKSMININSFVCSTFQDVCSACSKNTISQNNVIKINSVVDYVDEELHTGHWNSVPLTIRKCFYAASFIKAIVILSTDKTSQSLCVALKVLDMGILLGAPSDKNNNLLPNCAKLINKKIIELYNTQNFDVSAQNTNKRKLGDDYPEFNKIKATEIDVDILPSLEHFLKRYFSLHIPIKIQDSMTHWPAYQKWNDITYLLNVAGGRTVPIEIGSQYSDQNWSQKLMTFKNFVENYYLKKSQETGYLAQHNLFDQIPELKDDICIPEYCSLKRDLQGESSTLEINAWLGPSGTISSLHFDPKDNLLSQVYGTKCVIMFSPHDTEHLYPHSDMMLCNTSKLNPLNPNLELYPKFANVKMFKCLLSPGEMLYIPPKWWHYVVALENSFSVNFWWT